MAVIRPATEADLPAVTAIYNQAVLRETGTFDTEPKTLDQQRAWFARHGASHPVVVVEEAGKVAGWASLSPWSDRCAYARTAEVSVYVDEAARGRGLGGILLDAVIAAGRAAGLREVLARITEGNEASLRLHVKRGFVEAGRLRRVGEKFGRLLDVRMLQKSLAVLALLLAAALRAPAEDALRDSAMLLSAGDVAGARARAGAAAAAAPRDPRAWEQLARTELAALDFAAAEAAAGRALELGENPARLVLRSEARAGRRDFAGALADAERAVSLSPGSGPARLRRAAAQEGLRRPVDEILADYRRAAELDVGLAEAAASAAARLLPPSPPPAGARLGPILVVLAVSALFGWVWGMASKAGEPPAAAAFEPLLPGSGLLSARAALAAAAAASKAGSPDPRALAEALYERLTGRPAFPSVADRALGRYRAASEAGGLPAGIDAFFARALAPEPSRRFQTAAELVGAFRSLVDPPVL